MSCPPLSVTGLLEKFLNPSAATFTDFKCAVISMLHFFQRNKTCILGTKMIFLTINVRKHRYSLFDDVVCHFLSCFDFENENKTVSQ